MTREAIRTARRAVLTMSVALALAPAVAACGGDEENQPEVPAEDPELVEQAIQKIDRAAAASANPVRDRYIPGPKKFKIICLDPESARAKNVPPEFIQCHVEAFSTPSKRRPQEVYVESEDWRVQANPDGTISEPVIVDGYRIRDFLRKDHRLGCSVGRTPTDRCKSPFATGP